MGGGDNIQSGGLRDKYSRGSSHIFPRSQHSCLYYILTKSECISSCIQTAVGSNIVQITRSTFFVNVFFKWPPVAILDVQKSLLTISDHYHNFYFAMFLQNGCRWPF